MKPATKEMLTAQVKGLIMLALAALIWHGCSQLAFGQEKPDSAKTLTLSVDKLDAQLLQIESAIQKRQKELFDADPVLARLVGQYEGLAASKAKNLAPDSTKAKKPSK